MRIRYLILTLLALSMIFLAATVVSASDTLKLRDGTRIEGRILKVEDGTFFVAVATETRVVKMADVYTIDFNSDEKELADLLRQLDNSSAEIRTRLAELERYWRPKQPINATEESEWAEAKESFRKPLLAYQEVLNDLYFRVLNRVDEYNNLMKEANKLYVGIKGLRIGSSLVLPDLKELPLTKYVPGSWYDKIFENGYNQGFAEARSRMDNSR